MMITAIAMNEDRVAGHFSKAQSIAFINERGKELSRFANPALNTNCAGKQHLIDLLSKNNAQRVVVRNIGTQMLTRLLARQWAVFQVSGGFPDMATLASSNSNGLLPLTDLSQARPSPKHDAKKLSGCNCQHDGDALGTMVASGRCCQQDAVHTPDHRGHGQCHCAAEQQDNSGHGHGRGNGKCCHS
ncbi:NifB/NifX family molybdenum-iron cluster-binding protein [Acerihabitans sp. TG2]|uniref:NifB/NifX family molybdenum-iron cluster-binding protein n=1 Tax=Acerihabitans sp. TG2 TaxID=3096008 RepID=UPI002B2317BE|nr:NifB/NifX family molybdenum-iron cluster-binding protein [Acerihabitans sp. TG2]MEA9389689.1 NifB/NifX family molybdenum-iron cluster-binding protein [Acerihabitans sp. TG2]